MAALRTLQSSSGCLWPALCKVLEVRLGSPTGTASEPGDISLPLDYSPKNTYSQIQTLEGGGLKGPNRLGRRAGSFTDSGVTAQSFLLHPPSPAGTGPQPWQPAVGTASHAGVWHHSSSLKRRGHIDGMTTSERVEYRERGVEWEARALSGGTTPSWKISGVP